MTGMQVLLAALVAAAAAAPQERLSQGYLPPPPPPPPESYLPPPPTTPAPEYLPPPEEPEEEYLPPSPSPPSEEYLPPATDAGGQKEDSSSIADSDLNILEVDNALGEDAGQDASQDEITERPTGQFDDGQYRPGQYNSGQYDPNANRFRGDDGQYRPETVTFPAIEDFEFAYAVKDEASGNDFAVNESNKGGAYKVLLPDGRTQIVQYVIDSRGIYRSKITYLQPGETL